MEVKFGKNEQPVIDVEAKVTQPAQQDTKPADEVASQTPPEVKAELEKALKDRALREEVKPPVDTKAAAPEMAVAKRSAPVLGDYIPDFNDIILPRLNIVQNIGMLKDTFNPGEIVFGQSTVLFVPTRLNGKTGQIESQGTKPVTLTIVGFKMPIRFVEKVIGGVRGLIVNSEAEVHAANGTLDYNEWNLKKASGMKRFEPLAEALVAIERPEHLPDNGTTFVYDVAGRKYTFGWWAMKGTSYTEAAKRVFFTARRTGCLKEGYPTFSFSVSTIEKTFPNNNKAWIPVCMPNAKTQPELLRLIEDFLSPAPPAEEATADA